jgi:4-diphosphocytidyl-2-C-methyl-D-erythritol kinase
LGSDVPFFLGSPAAIISGVGDVVEPLEARSDYSILLIYPGFMINTGEAYGYYDWWRERQTNPRKSMAKEELTRLYEGARSSQWCFSNSFQGPIGERYPVIKKTCRKLQSLGASIAGISGSGSAMIGVFETELEEQNWRQSVFCRISKPNSPLFGLWPLLKRNQFLCKMIS